MIYAVAYDISLTRYDIHLRCIDVSLTRRLIKWLPLIRHLRCHLPHEGEGKGVRVNERVLEKVLSVRKNPLLRTDGFDNKKGFPLVGKLREAVMRGKAKRLE